MSDVLNTLQSKLAEIVAQRAEAAKRAAAGGPAASSAAMMTRAVDALGSPHGAGTNRLHVVLAAAYAAGVCLTRREIKEAANYGNADNHLNTMRGKGRAQSDGRGLWRLTDAAGQLWHGEGKLFGFAPIGADAQADAQADAPKPTPKAKKKAKKAPETAAEEANAPETGETSADDENAAIGE